MFNHLTDEGSIPSSSTAICCEIAAPSVRLLRRFLPPLDRRNRIELPRLRSLSRMSGTIIESSVGGYIVSTDPLRVDVDIVHGYLSDESYWAAGRGREVVARSLANSAIIVGAYHSTGAMVGFARMVTDLATFAWLCDLFVLDGHKGRGLGIALVQTLVEHPDVVDVKRQLLATADAHELYRRFGYGPLDDPSRWPARPAQHPQALRQDRRAAEQGDADAQSNLGLMYGLGRGVPRDYIRAHMWLTLAMSRVRGEDGASFARTRHSVAKKMTGEQIAEARRLAHAWKPKTWDELQAGGASSDAV